MRRSLALLSTCLTLGCLPMGGLALSSGDAQAQDVIRFYNWSDYVAPSVLSGFEAQTGIKIEITTYASNEELYAGLKLRPGYFDLIVPDHWLVKRLGEEGMLEEINGPKLPGFWNIQANWLNAPHDPINQYSLPYLWGSTSFAVDTKQLPNGDESLGTLFQPPASMKGHVVMLGEATELVALASLYLGLPRCTESPEDLDQIEGLLNKQKPFVSSYITADWANTMEQPQNSIVMSWNGETARARQHRPSLKYAYPKEGVLAWLSTIAIPKNAPHKDLALQFMSYLLRPEVAAKQTAFTHYANAIKASYRYLPADIAQSPEFTIPAKERVEFLVSCPASATDKYREMYLRLTGKP